MEVIPGGRWPRPGPGVGPRRYRDGGRSGREEEPMGEPQAEMPKTNFQGEAPEREFWRGLQPIKQVFRPGALPEAYIADAPTEDERFYAPLSETVGSRPLWISPSQNRWCDVLYSRSAGLVNRHYHPQQVFAFTLSGRWGYLEHE